MKPDGEEDEEGHTAGGGGGATGAGIAVDTSVGAAGAGGGAGAGAGALASGVKGVKGATPTAAQLAKAREAGGAILRGDATRKVLGLGDYAVGVDDSDEDEDGDDDKTGSVVGVCEGWM